MTEFVLDTYPQAVPDVAGRDLAPESDWLRKYQEEIDTYYSVLKNLNGMEVADIFRTLSAYSARASELRTRLSRVDTKRAQSFRTREVEPLIEELDRQYKLQSRCLSVMEIELRLSGERGVG